MLDLYGAVAFGMWGYSHAAFRVEILGRKRFRLEPGTLILATHRRETDVPVLCPPLYYGAGLGRDVGHRMSFAARDDMFLPGFFAGFPPGLPAWARRLLYPVGVGRWLPRVKVHPIRSASVARLAEVLRARPDSTLGELLPPETVEPLQRRAELRGLAPLRLAGDVLRHEYADLLWAAVGPEAASRELLAEFWSRRAVQATADFRALVELLRAGGSLVLFPEGWPSAQGDIGPVRPGSAALLRRGRPARIQPLGLAYDPLVRGRTRVFVSLPEPVEPPADDLERSLLAIMRRSMPLTAGQFAADRLLAGAEAEPQRLERELAAAVEAARAESRPVEPDLLRPESRRRRLAEAFSVAPRRLPREIAFLAREFESAREEP